MEAYRNTEHDGKTVKSIAKLSYTQLLITFTDGSELCITARIDDGKPWIVTRIMAGHIEKEWAQ